MLKRTSGALIGLITMAMASQASAVENKYHITDAEQNACGADVISVCGDGGQDEDRLLACMKANRLKLSAHCRSVFDDGLRRRGL